MRPDTAFVVRESPQKQGVKWEDEKWIAGRKERQGRDKPISIYELYLGYPDARKDRCRQNWTNRKHPLGNAPEPSPG